VRNGHGPYKKAIRPDPTVTADSLGPMRLTDALLPRLLKQKEAVVMVVTSGLAFVPSAFFPTYSATKAALLVHVL